MVPISGKPEIGGRRPGPGRILRGPLRGRLRMTVNIKHRRGKNPGDSTAALL
jgi:hypothetical protein